MKTVVAKPLRLPSNWHTLSYVQKAALLCTTKQARDYSDACSILSKRKGRPRAIVSPQDYARRMEQLKLF